MEEPTDVEIAEDPILKFFRYRHLPESLQDVSREYARLALWTLRRMKRSAERTVAFRKLLEAKDAAVRAAMES